MVKYCGIMDVCEALEEALPPQFSSYGVSHEFGPDGTIKRSLKPSILFRGQNEVHDTVQAQIFRKYRLTCTWEKDSTLRFGNKRLHMPHPHYSEELQFDLYFSCVKALDIVRLVKKILGQVPGEVDGHALCQHYGLATPFLDFSEDLWISGFFASHTYPALKPVTEGVGVLYVLDTSPLPEEVCYEIGIQPLERPFAQRGWLMKTYPGLNVASLSSIRPYYFQHSEKSARCLAKKVGDGAEVVPSDTLSDQVEKMLKCKSVTEESVRQYCQLGRSFSMDTQETEKTVRRFLSKGGVRVL